MNINHTKMTLEINSCKNYEILEVRQGDKGSRIIDFAFTVNGETVDLASTPLSSGIWRQGLISYTNL